MVSRQRFGEGRCRFGLHLFESAPGHKNCNGCHFNGGGSAGMSFNDQTPGFPDIDGSPRGFNIGAGTNVNEIPLALALNLPRDGGFGQILTVFGSFGNTDDLPLLDAAAGHLRAARSALASPSTLPRPFRN